MIPIITPSVMQEEEASWDIQKPLERINTSGKALFESIVNVLHSDDHLLFVVGKGLNGADTLCLAEHCLEAGFEISVMCLFETKDFKEETHHFYSRLQKFHVIKPFSLPKKGRYIIIDGVFGAGFKGTVDENIRKIFHEINQSPFHKIAIDIPSGICGETGLGDHAIRCDLTLSIGLPKWGLFVKNGRLHSGHIQHVEIGLKKQISAKKALGFYMHEESLDSLYPNEPSTFHKYQKGQVLGFASHNSFRGASFFYTKAAYRTGAGLVRLFHEKGAPFFNDMTPEVTQHEFQELDKFLDKQKTACVIGPGLIMSSQYSNIISKILEKKIPCVIDGGALEIITSLKLHHDVVLTPHLDELKKLLKTESSDFDDLIKQSSNHLLQSGLTLIVKGHHTWILHQDQKPIISAFAPSCMATAGSGDVLAGIIGCFLAKNMSSLESAILGVGIHSLSGQLAGSSKSKKAIIASDIIDAIPEALELC
jgi:ADP-dependent NAD(P)H-hydrate dehydratase / NAD(P)H-hydrate epimerase